MLFDVNWFRMTALKGCLEVFEMVPVERILKEQIKSWNSDELFIGMTILLTIIADICKTSPIKEFYHTSIQYY